MSLSQQQRQQQRPWLKGLMAKAGESRGVIEYLQGGQNGKQARRGWRSRLRVLLLVFCSAVAPVDERTPSSPFWGGWQGCTAITSYSL